MSQGAPIPGIEGAEDVGPLGLSVVADVLFAPGRAFARLARQPRWLGSFLVALLITGTGAWIALPVSLEFGAETAVATMDRLGIPEADRAEALERLPDPEDRSPRVLLQHVGGAIALTAVFGVLGALVLYGIALISGRAPGLGPSFALFSGAFVVTGLGNLVKSALIATSGSVEVTLGPGALVPDLPYHSIPSILLDTLDVFSLWNLALLTVGGATLWRVSRGAAFAVCGTYWILKAVVVIGARIFGAWMLGAL